MLRRCAVLLLTCALWFAATRCRAHDPGLSELTVSHGALGARFEWIIGNDELPRSAAHCAADSGIVFSLDHKALPVRVSCRRYDDTHTALSSAIATLEGGALQIDLRRLQRLPRGHRVFAVVLDQNGQPIERRLLDRTNPVLHTTIAPTARAPLWSIACVTLTLIAVAFVVTRRPLRAAPR